MQLLHTLSPLLEGQGKMTMPDTWFHIASSTRLLPDEGIQKDATFETKMWQSIMIKH